MNGDFQISDEHRSWAANILQLDPQLPPAKLSQLALQRLSSDDFVLWKQADIAVRVLAGSAQTRWSPSDLNCFDEVTEGVRYDEVERFCQEFFDLEPEERKQHHGELLERCQQFPALALRLEQLIPGLEIQRWSKREAGDVEENETLAEDVSDQMYELGSEIFNIFLAHPSERGKIETQLKRSWSKTPGRDRNVAVDFSVRFPEITCLAPGFVRRIQTLQAPTTRRRTHADPFVRRQTDQKGSDQRLGYGVGIYVAILFLFGALFRLVADNSPNNPSYQQESKFDTTEFISRKIEEENVRQGLEAMKRIKEYESNGRSRLGNDSSAKHQENPFTPFSMKNGDGRHQFIFTEAQLQELLDTHPELKQQVESQRSISNQGNSNSKNFSGGRVLILKGNREIINEMNSIKKPSSSKTELPSAPFTSEPAP